MSLDDKNNCYVCLLSIDEDEKFISCPCEKTPQIHRTCFHEMLKNGTKQCARCAAAYGEVDMKKLRKGIRMEQKKWIKQSVMHLKNVKTKLNDKNEELTQAMKKKKINLCKQICKDIEKIEAELKPQEFAKELDVWTMLEPYENNEDDATESELACQHEIQKLWAEKAVEIAESMTKKDLLEIALVEMAQNQAYRDDTQLDVHSHGMSNLSLKFKDAYMSKTKELKAVVVRTADTTLLKVIHKDVPGDLDQEEDCFSHAKYEEKFPKYLDFE